MLTRIFEAIIGPTNSASSNISPAAAAAEAAAAAALHGDSYVDAKPMERLGKLGLPEGLLNMILQINDDINHYHDTITLELMNDPIILIPPEELARYENNVQAYLDAKHQKGTKVAVYDRSTALTWSDAQNLGPNKCTHPDTRQVCEIHSHTSRKQEIQALLTMIAMMQEHYPQQTDDYYSHQSVLASLDQHDAIPAEYRSDIPPGRIMTYPVKITSAIYEDDQTKTVTHTVDMMQLMRYWSANEKNLGRDPVTGTRLHEIHVDEALFHRIRLFVHQQQRPEAHESIETQVDKAKAIADSKRKDKSSKASLTDAGYSLDKVPDDFIGHNFDGDIMTHPVRLDGIYFVDFDRLQSYWRTYPQFNHCNPYTQQPIKQIVYDQVRKNQIDQFVANPSEDACTTDQMQKRQGERFRASIPMLGTSPFLARSRCLVAPAAIPFMGLYSSHHATMRNTATLFNSTGNSNGFPGGIPTVATTTTTTTTVISSYVNNGDNDTPPPSPRPGSGGAGGASGSQ